MPLRTILITATRSGTASTVIIRRGASGTGTGGTGDHGALTGLGDDDHTQYHNDARGDARYPLGSGTSTGTNTGDQDLSSYATTSALAGKASLTGNPNFTGGITVDNGNSNIAGIIADGLVFGDRLSIDNDSQFIGPVTMFTPLPITSGGTGAASDSAARTALGIPDPPVAKTATSDVVISNQAGVLTDAARNDSQLNLFAVDPNSTYRVTIYFEYSSTTTTAGIKIGVNFPSLAAPATQRGGIGVTANGVLVNIPNVAAGLFQLTSGVGGTRVQLTGTIIARTGSTGGFADFRWGQLTSSTDPTTRHAGSTVTFEKIA